MPRMLPLPELKYSRQKKRNRAHEVIHTAEPESQLPQAPAKRQKRSGALRPRSSPEFWNRLSRVPLCRRALREFDGRVVVSISPQQSAAERAVENSQVKQLKRFARRGGPDLCRIRGYSEQESNQKRPKMPPKRVATNRSNRSDDRNSNARPTRYSSKDAAFEQELIDNGIFPPGYDDSEPENMEELLEWLRQPRASLSPSKFVREDFLHFRRASNEATNEAEVMSQVFPMITGKTNIPSGYNQVFNNLAPLGDYICNPQPDYFNGTRAADIRPKVRVDLEKHIIPSSQRHRPAVPNFFTEVKGPDGKASAAKRQITQDLVAGARAMLSLQSYELDKPVVNDNAYTFGSIYSSGTGTLQLYAMHPSQPAHLAGKPTYHATQIDSYGLTGNINTCRQGLGAFRNLRDLAREKRDDAIVLANLRADGNELEIALPHAHLTSFTSTSQSAQSELFTADADGAESDSTSIDECAMPAPPAKRTRTRRNDRKKTKCKTSNLVVEDNGCQCDTTIA